jgi:hypothetical protein
MVKCFYCRKEFHGEFEQLVLNHMSICWRPKEERPMAINYDQAIEFIEAIKTRDYPVLQKILNEMDEETGNYINEKFRTGEETRG